MIGAAAQDDAGGGETNVGQQGDTGQSAASDDAAAADHFHKIRLGTAGAGAAFAVLFVVSMLALAQAPGPRASDEAILRFYGGNDRRWLLIVGLYLLPLSAVAFLWFTAALREWVSGSTRRLSQVLSNVQLLSGIGFIVLALASSAATTVAAFETEFTSAVLDPADARQFPLYGSALLYVFAMRLAAIFVTSSTSIIRSSGVFPAWFHWVSYAVALFLFLVATIGVWLVLIFPAWVLLLSGLIAFRGQAIRPFAAARSDEASHTP